jgi:hypothetical protein
MPQTVNGTNGKRQPYVFNKRKMEMANFRLFAANENGLLFSLVSTQTANRQLLSVDAPIYVGRKHFLLLYVQ